GNTEWPTSWGRRGSDATPHSGDASPRPASAPSPLRAPAACMALMLSARSVRPRGGSTTRLRAAADLALSCSALHQTIGPRRPPVERGGADADGDSTRALTS